MLLLPKLMSCLSIEAMLFYSEVVSLIYCMGCGCRFLMRVFVNVSFLELPPALASHHIIRLHGVSSRRATTFVPIGRPQPRCRPHWTNRSRRSFLWPLLPLLLLPLHPIPLCTLALLCSCRAPFSAAVYHPKPQRTRATPKDGSCAATWTLERAATAIGCLGPL